MSLACGALIEILILAALCTWIQADQIRLPPTIVNGPPLKHKLYKLQEPYEIPCKAIGTPTPEYRWYQNGKELSRDEFIEISAEDGTLRFTEMMSYHSGYYQCSASNYNGVAFSKVIFLQQAVASNFPPQNNPVPYEVTEGQPLQIKCEGAKSVPMAQTEFSWTVATNPEDLGFTVTLNKRKFIDDKGNLYFAHTLPEDHQDKKTYKCNMRNKYLDVIYGGSYSTVSVKADPSKTPTQPLNMYSTGPSQVALVGKELVMRCFFSGNPDPTLEWKKRSGNLPTGRYTKSVNGDELTIHDVQADDAGVYVCYAHNNGGISLETTIDISVQSEPTWTPNGQPKNLNATQGSAVSFLCRVSAEPKADVQWYINGTPLDKNNPGSGRLISADGTNLTVLDVQKPRDIMNVQCNTSNTHGYEYADAYLNVLLPTVVSVAPESHEVDINTTEIFISCNASADIMTPVTVDWLLNNKPLSEEPGVIEKVQHSLRINFRGMNIEKRMQFDGTYTAVAMNGYSEAQASCMVNVKGPPVTSQPVVAGASGFQLWMIALIVVGVLLIFLLILFCCLWCQRNREVPYPVDEKERAQGNNPAKEVEDGGFKDYVRPEEAPVKGSRASLNSSIKLDSDDEGSLNEYGDMDPTKFNEDGSFIGLYADDLKKNNKDNNVYPPPYTATKNIYSPVSRHTDTEV